MTKQTSERKVAKLSGKIWVGKDSILSRIAPVDFTQTSESESGLALLNKHHIHLMLKYSLKMKRSAFKSRQILSAVLKHSTWFVFYFIQMEICVFSIEKILICVIVL